jgi:hypothetical protein
MKCKFGFYTCANCIEHMCETCEDGDNYEIKYEQDEVQEMQGEI